MKLPRVASAKETREGLYIGREFAGFKASPFLNPFSVGQDTPQNREIAVWKWLKWFLDQPVRMELQKVRDADQIVCWCTPSLCHGDGLTWLLTLQQFLDPCPKCGDPGLSILNGFQNDPRTELLLVYEFNKCARPGCGHYRFGHRAWATPDTIPTWRAANAPSEAAASEPTLL